jgi:hypothetical protein
MSDPFVPLEVDWEWLVVAVVVVLERVMVCVAKVFGGAVGGEVMVGERKRGPRDDDDSVGSSAVVWELKLVSWGGSTADVGEGGGRGDGG